MTTAAVIILVFALVFALLEAWKGSNGIKPTNFGWLALGLLIVVHLFFRGADLLK